MPRNSQVRVIREWYNGFGPFYVAEIRKPSRVNTLHPPIRKPMGDWRTKHLPEVQLMLVSNA